MAQYEERDTPYNELGKEAKFVNTLWWTPIFTVLIILLIVINIPNTLKITTIALLLLAHILQFSYTFFQWRKDQRKSI